MGLRFQFPDHFFPWPPLIAILFDGVEAAIQLPFLGVIQNQIVRETPLEELQNIMLVIDRQ